MLREAFAAVQRNYTAYFLYLAIHVPVNAAIFYLWVLWLTPMSEELDSGLVRLVDVGTSVISAVVWALAQCIVFARIGRDMDRPDWKVSSDKESIKRFFAFWLLLDLGIFLIVQLQAAAITSFGSEELAQMMELVKMLYAIMVVPLGAAVMFHGHVGRKEIGKAFSVLFAEFPFTLVAMMIALCSHVVLMSLLVSLITAGGRSLAAFPVVDIVDKYVDCFVFSCVWFICMRNREQESDSDLDF